MPSPNEGVPPSLATDRVPDPPGADVVAPRLLAPTPPRSTDRAAEFDAVFERERARLYGLAFTVVRDRHEAEDAVQETMARAWRRWDTLRDPSARGAWLTRICLNYCFRRRPRLARVLPFGGRDERVVHESTAARTRSGIGTEGDGPGRDAAVIAGPWTARAAAGPRDLDLDRAFQVLPLRQRAALLLHYHHGYTVEQCSEIMNCRPGTVRTHVQRGLATLRQEMGDA